MTDGAAQRRSTSLGWRLTLTAIGIVAALWLASLALVIAFEHLDTRAKSQAIVILGAAQYAGHPSPVLRARVDHALELWRNGFAPFLIVTGGQGVGDTTTEAAVERRYAMSHGVPDSAIMMERQGRTTAESLRQVATMLGAGPSRVILVSDPFHMLRLAILARRFGLRARTSPTRTSPISANAAAFWRYTLQESWKAPAAFFFEFYDRR
jgi:uncharacterized SAM-binding protein YcdF (DUF218 family)